MPRAAPSCWLLKTEPDVFSVADLARKGRERWDGIRNHQARNTLRDAMRAGDLAFIYHSNASPSGLAGLGRIEGEPYADPLQFDPTSPYVDPKSPPDAPRWLARDVSYVETFPRFVPLPELRQDPELEGFALLARGQRLSILPVSPEHARRLLRLAGASTRLR